MAKKEAKPAESETTPGSTTIAPGVLVTIARLSALQVDGVQAMASIPGSVNRFFRREVGQGVRVDIDGNSVSVEIHVILELGTDLHKVSREVQQEVARAMEDIVGMRAHRVDVHIEDILVPRG